MPSVNIRQLPKLSAIPRPIQVTHKPRQYFQLKKPKDNWSGYNVLPAIGTKELDDFITNENDFNDKEPTKYDDISDSEFLYDQMTAELDEMLKREAGLKIVREKAFTQYLELKSNFMDWVIKLAHNNIWVPVKNTGIPERVSLNPSSVKDDLGKYVPSPPTCPKESSPARNTPESFVPRPPSCPKDEPASRLSTENVVPKPLAYSNYEPPTVLSTDKVVSKPLAYPNDEPPTVLSTGKVVPKPLVYPNDELPTGVSTDKVVPKPLAYPNDKPATGLSTDRDVPTASANPKEDSAIGLSINNVLPKPPAYPKNQPPTHLSTDKVPQSPANPRHISSTTDIFEKFVPRPPAYPKNKSPIRVSPDTLMILPTPPGKPRVSNKKSRKFRKPDIVPELTIPSSSLSHIPELPSSRIDLSLI